MKWAHPLRGRSIRQALADALDVYEEDLDRNPPVYVRDYGCVSWTGPYRGSEHYHSWDSMKDCLKYGFDVCGDLCVVARDNDWNHKKEK